MIDYDRNDDHVGYERLRIALFHYQAFFHSPTVDSFAPAL